MTGAYSVAAPLFLNSQKTKSTEYRGSSCERIKYWLNLTSVLLKKYKRRDKSNLRFDLQMLCSSFNAVYSIVKRFHASVPLYITYWNLTFLWDPPPPPLLETSADLRIVLFETNNSVYDLYFTIPNIISLMH